MEAGIDRIRQAIRGLVRHVAVWLNKVSKGKISPDFITYIGLLMHIPIAFLIAYGVNYWAAGLLVIFGLFDTLDGELARIQGVSSTRGMLLDASTDKMKEVLLYTGAGLALAQSSSPAWAAWAVAACGASLTVSFVKAKGEAAIAANDKVYDHATLNKIFADGLMRFEIRMSVLIAGLLFNQLAIAIALIAVLAGMTAIGRLQRIFKELD
ncbi:MAG TPA: CDP-alcohol phosphatidyltransferase family protein [Candidatus Saccharimonadales bacterium]|nr:CDP-alcohol phosphatidyltransferase family protein [Candidatus Saccharimonadales bacterium]